MIKTWLPVFEDVATIISRLECEIKDLPFNIDFYHRSHLIKIQISGLYERLYNAAQMAKSDFAAKRIMIDELSAEMITAQTDLFKRLTELRLLRAERNRANYLHVQELKKAAEKNEETEKNG